MQEERERLQERVAELQTTTQQLQAVGVAGESELRAQLAAAAEQAAELRGQLTAAVQEREALGAQLADAQAERQRLDGKLERHAQVSWL